MPQSQNPIVEWPTELFHLLHGIRIASGEEGKRYGRIEVDVDPAILFHLNDFEARARHRQVRLRLAGEAECLIGEMNVVVGLGAADDPTLHIGKVRISFHDLQDDGCVDPVSQA